MLSIDSLPRKWSMRKIWLSSKYSVSAALSLLRRAEVDAEGLLTDDPGVHVESLGAEHLDTTSCIASGGIARW